MILEKNIECTGCGMCAAVCPEKVLDLKMNEEGFYQPVMVNDKCTECGLCEKVCPAYNIHNNFNKPLSSYSAYSRHDETRESCTSGGIAYEITKLMLRKKREICGVIYDYDSNTARHIISHNEEDLETMKGSKYIQSCTLSAFTEIVSSLGSKKHIVFGSPCQIGALDRYAKFSKKRNNIILVDFFCHGTPSYLLWENYIKVIQKKQELIRDIKFRDKKYGWHNFTVAIKTKDKIYYSDKNRDKDLFYEFYLGNYCLNQSCYSCQFHALNSKADIRIGDLWGSKYSNEKKGVSGVITFTKEGQKIIDELKDCCELRKESLKTVLEGQIKKEIRIPELRRNILDDLMNKKSLPGIYYRRIFPFKVKRKIKRFSNRFLEG